MPLFLSDLWFACRTVLLSLFNLFGLLNHFSHIRIQITNEWRLNISSEASEQNFWTVTMIVPLHCIPWKESIGRTWGEYPGCSYCTVFRRCEYSIRTCVADIQEFYELTLLDDTKSIQQKTAETIRIANKWEASDGPITPTYSNNDVSYFIYQHAKGSELSPKKEASAEFLRSVSRISCQCAQHGKSFPKNTALQALTLRLPD